MDRLEFFSLRFVGVGFAILVFVLVASSAALAAPIMYGVDEDDGQLFRISDYDTSPTFEDLGLLTYDGGTPVGNDIEAMTLDPNGIMYMALDDSISGSTGPVLLTYDIADIGTCTEVTIVGSLGIGTSADNVSGLSIDPLTGDLYALLRTGGSSAGLVDQLYRIPDPNNAPGVSTLIGDLTDGATVPVRVLNGEDMEFGADGKLYVVENGGDEPLFEIALQRNVSDQVIQSITGVSILSNIQDTLGEVKFEALGWDFENEKLIGSDDDGNRFAQLLPLPISDLGALGSTGLTDVEGIDFVPLGEAPPDVEPPANGVPAPATLALLGLGFAGLALKRRKQIEAA